MQKAFRGSTSPYDIFTHTQEAPAPGPGSCSSRAASRRARSLPWSWFAFPKSFWIFFSYFSFDQTGRDARRGTGDVAEWRSHVHLLWKIKLPGLNSSGAAGGLPKPRRHQQSPPDVGRVPGGAGGPRPCGVCTAAGWGVLLQRSHWGAPRGGLRSDPQAASRKIPQPSAGLSAGLPLLQSPAGSLSGGQEQAAATAQPRHEEGDTREPLAREVEGERGALGPTGARPHVRAAPAAACPARSFGKRTLREHFPLWMLEPDPPCSASSLTFQSTQQEFEMRGKKWKCFEKDVVNIRKLQPNIENSISL